MKKTEYKVEVGSIRLSEEFKSNLKARMLEEYNSVQGAAASADAKPITVSGAKWKKYSKYAAAAACLLIAVSTVSVLSVKGIKAGNPVDDSADEIKLASDMTTELLNGWDDDDDAIPMNEETEDEEIYYDDMDLPAEVSESDEIFATEEEEISYEEPAYDIVESVREGADTEEEDEEDTSQRSDSDTKVTSRIRFTVKKAGAPVKSGYISAEINIGGNKQLLFRANIDPDCLRSMKSPRTPRRLRTKPEKPARVSC